MFELNSVPLMDFELGVLFQKRLCNSWPCTGWVTAGGNLRAGRSVTGLFCIIVLLLVPLQIGNLVCFYLER